MKKAFRKKEPENLIEMVPVLNDKFRIDEINEKYYLIIPRTTMVEKAAIKFLKQPKEHRYKLDDLGLFVLNHCNGDYTVGDIENLLHEHFGDKAEPTLARLVKFLQILDTNHIVTLK
ncbi:PqqD family protein [Scopulibacillus cellulosilyticus]|uniref:PqqD family protein n=1 Tax=Scopulibacillus cellulosilyticus TaxID=2665665 RepID=A0ABW2Q1E7_9BACL